MNEQILLTPVPLNDLIEKFRSIVREEIAAHHQTDEEKLISADKACKIFDPSITRPTLQSWVDQGFLKSYRISGRVWFKHSEVVAGAKEIKKYKKPGEQKSTVEV